MYDYIKEQREREEIWARRKREEQEKEDRENREWREWYASLSSGEQQAVDDKRWEAVRNLRVVDDVNNW